MDHKLSVLVQVDLNGAYVRLAVTGCLTEANQHVLHPLIHRARSFIPPVTVSIDLTAATHVEAGGVDLLRWAIDYDDTLAGASPVRVALPDAFPEHASVPHRAGHPVQNRRRAA